MPEPIIKREDAARMKFPIEVDRIRAGIAKLLEVPEIAKFIGGLLELAPKVSEKPGNTLVAGVDVLRVFDIVQEQDKMFRGKGNLAHGCIDKFNAKIELGGINPGMDKTMKEFQDECLTFDIPLALHETIHHAGRLCFTDRDLAMAVCLLVGKDINKELPTPQDRTIDGYSNFWHKELMKVCKPTLKKLKV